MLDLTPNGRLSPLRPSDRIGSPRIDSMSRQLILAILTTAFVFHQTLSSFVPKGRKCRLQEQHCDIMHPEKQCCPGTSCGIRRINNNMVNICLMCRDIGQPCSADKGGCCKGLRCQKITQFASVCNPIDYKFFTDYDTGPKTSGKASPNLH